MDSNTLIVEDCNVALSTMDKTSRQKISEKTLDLDYTLNQMDLTDIYMENSRVYILLKSK